VSQILAIRKMALVLGCRDPEIRIRFRMGAEHHSVVSIIEMNQTSGPAFDEDSANCAEIAIDLVEKKLEARIKERVVDLETQVRVLRAALPIGDAQTVLNKQEK
jgi:hypothetical protein